MRNSVIYSKARHVRTNPATNVIPLERTESSLTTVSTGYITVKK